MSFLDVTKKVGGMALKAGKHTLNKMTEAREEASGKSNSELQSIAKNGSGFKKVAAAQELKERGY